MQRIVFFILSIALAFTNVFPISAFSHASAISVPLQQEPTVTLSPTAENSTATPTPENTSKPTEETTATIEPTEISVTPTIESPETTTPTATHTEEVPLTPEVTITEDVQEEEFLAFLDLKASPRFIRPGGKVNLHWSLNFDPIQDDKVYTMHIQPPSYMLVEENEPFSINEDGILVSTDALDKSNGTIKFDVLDEIIEGDSTTIIIQLFRDGEKLIEQELSLINAKHVSRDDGGEISGAKDKRAKVIFPPNALPEDADVVVMDLGWEDGSLQNSSSDKPWHPFKIEAYTRDGEEIEHFDQDITIEYIYDPEEFAGNEQVLYLSYFDEENQVWAPLDGYVDLENNRIIARSDHLTVLNPNYSDWQAAMLPSMAGWQTATFTGAATYSIPLTLPAGPGGFSPSLELSYNSQVIDNASLNTQASWVGMGWSLDVPYIQRDNHGTWNNVEDDYFYITMNGISGLLVKGDDGYWHTEDVNFARIQLHGSTTSYQSWWEVWLQDGTRYWFGYQVGDEKSIADYPYCESDTESVKLPWRWSLSHIIDSSGQQIRYRYALHEEWREAITCSDNPTAVFWIYPTEIIYPNNAYRIVFTWGDRKDYYYYWRPEISSNAKTAFMERRLNAITIQHNLDTSTDFVTTENIRRYLFTYANDAVAGIENTIIWPGYQWTNGFEAGPLNKTLTLIRFQEQIYGENDQWNDLPPYTFNYGTGATTDGITYPNGDAQHIRWVENGYGGRIEFTYSPWSCNDESSCALAWDSTNQNDSWKVSLGDLGPTRKQFYSGDQDNLIHPGARYELHLQVERLYGDAGTNSQILGELDNGTGYQRAVLNETFVNKAAPITINKKYWIDGNAIPKYVAVDTECAIGYGTGCHIFEVQYRYMPTFYRVTAMKTIDQQSNASYTTTYSYSGGKMNETVIDQKSYMRNPPFTEFRGFAQVIETAPDGHKTIYKYWQSAYLQGRLQEVQITGANTNQIFQRTLYTYQVLTGSDLPFSRVSTYWWPVDIALNWVVLLREETYTHTGDLNTYIGKKVVYSYDAASQGGAQWGNLTNQVEYEWINGAWQAMRGVKTTYNPNVSSSVFLVSLPGRAQTFECSGTGCDFSGEPIGETQYIYDSNTSYTTPPVSGNLSRVRTKLSADEYIDMLNLYDPYGNLVQTTQYTGYGTAATFATQGAQTTTFCYGGGQPAGCPDDGHHTYLLWVQDAMPNHPPVAYSYDHRTGNLLSETDMNGNTTQADYDDYGRLVKVARHGDSLSVPTFNAEYIYQTPMWSSGSYGFSTRVTQRIDVNTSVVLQKYYNGLGQLLQTRVIGAEVNGANQDIIGDYAYDGMGRLWKQAMPRAVATGGDMAVQDFTSAVSMTYDPVGRALLVTQPDGTTTGYAYTISGNTLVTTSTDALGNITQQKTDALGRLLSVLPAGYPANSGVSYEYDALDRLTGATYGSASTEIAYDLAGRKTSMSDPDMGDWYYAYDALGNLTRQTDANGQRICLYYDSLNRLNGKFYNSNDNCPSSPSYDIAFTYDSGANNLGYLTGMSDTSGYTTWNYDARGRLSGELKNVTGSGSFLTQWTYYSNDAVETMTYPGGNSGQAGEIINYSYNSQSLLESMTSSEANYVPEIVYDEAGRVENLSLGGTTSDPVIQKEFVYYPWNDQGGRLNTISSALQTLTYTYDDNGNINQMVDTRSAGSETLHYEYDSLNRLEAVTGAYLEDVTYDSNGRIAVRNMQGDYGTVFIDDFGIKNLSNWSWGTYATVPFDFDNEKVIKSVGNSDYESSVFSRSTTTLERTTIHVRFQLSQTGSDTRFFFGLMPTLPEPECTYICDISLSSRSGFTLQSDFGLLSNNLISGDIYTHYNQVGLKEDDGVFYYYESDTDGNETLTALLTNVQANTWYDLAIYRGSGNTSMPLTITITQESDPTKTGTLTQTVSDIDWHFRHTIRSGIAYIDNYLESRDATVYTYGSKPHAVSDLTYNGQTIRQYSYDDNGNMIMRVEGADTYIFAYDKENHLTSGTKNGVTLATYVYDGNGTRVKAVENGVTTVYIGDYYESRSDSTTTTEVKYYSANGQRIAMRTNGTLMWLLGDHLGSTTLTANADGTLASGQTYTAWGETRSGSVSTDRQYTGQISEPQLGIYFYNTRYYDPYITQFTQPDSIIPDPYNPLDWNRYAYARSNPLKYTDPDGHFPWLVIPILIFIATIPGDTGPYEVDPVTAAVGDAALRCIDPVDWFYTAVDCLSGNCSSTDVYLGMLPFVNGGMDDVVDAARALGSTDALAHVDDVVETVGQFHHIFSNKIMNALNEHTTLRGVFSRNDFKVQGLDAASHNGYDAWHRAYDQEVVNWLSDNPRATPDQFLRYMEDLYQRTEMDERFPQAWQLLQMAIEEWE